MTTSKTNQFSNIEEKMEAIVKTVKREFPDLTSGEIGTIVSSIVSIEIKA